MTAPLAFAPDHDLDDIDLGALLSRRFLLVDGPVELSVLVPGRKPWVAHAMTGESEIRLMHEGERIRGGTGVYMVSNTIRPDIVARYEPDVWHMADNHRASDKEITSVCSLYIDCDAERPSGISATDQEKRCAYDLSLLIERYLTEAFGGDDSPIGRFDTGNGFALLLALEPFAPTDATTTKLQRFLSALGKRFRVRGAVVDTTTHNPARLVPAPGTLKTKGANTAGRPHRRTHFICRPDVLRVRLGDL